MVVDFIKEKRMRDHGIGGGKLWRMYLKEYGKEHPVGYNRFYDIIDCYGLKVRTRRRRTSTTDSRHGLPTYPNLVRNLIPTRPNQLWASDITYMPIGPDVHTGESRFSYLSVVTDCYTKEIIGWCLGDTLETRFTVHALDMALSRIPPDASSCGLIHHSDRGIQYASHAYTEILKSRGISISMTECGDPKENAVAERVNGIIKNELLMGLTFSSINKARKAVADAVDFYNNERPHMSLNWMTPAEAALCTGELKKKWSSRREKYIKGEVV